jgi:hypothetical protein
MSDDPEQLLAEALRAQAARAPRPPQPPADDVAANETTTSLNVAPGGYGLLSGSDEGSLERERRALDDDTSPPARPVTRQRPTRTGPSVPAVLALALALGVLTGAVVGLLTLL